MYGCKDLRVVTFRKVASLAFPSGLLADGPRHRMGRGGDGGDFSRRLQPSPVEIAMQMQETVSMEDKLRVSHWLRTGAPGADAAPKPTPPPPRREALLEFVQSQQEQQQWRKVLADPAAANAMRALRGRVSALKAEGRAIAEMRTPPPEATSRLLNRRQKGPNQFLSTTLNPLESSGLMKGWDPRARAWTGQRGLANLPKDPTSLWCAGWGACANEGDDFDFEYIQHAAPLPKGYEKAEHTRAFRT